MEDLQARVEKLLAEAEHCALIGKFATDVRKRDLFNKLATDLRRVARDVEVVMASRRAESKGEKFQLSKRFRDLRTLARSCWSVEGERAVRVMESVN